MSTDIYIQWLSQSTKEELPQSAPDTAMDELEPVAVITDHYRWYKLDAQANPDTVYHGSQDELIQWLLAHEYSRLNLILPGEKLVVHQLPYSEKEKRHFAKTLPYEMEEYVVDDVDELHFSIGPLQSGVASIIYTHKQWFDHIWQTFAQHDIWINRCVSDFHLLSAQDNEVIFYCKGDRLLVNDANGIGFATHQTLMTSLLPAYLNTLDADQQLRIYVCEEDGVVQEPDSVEHIFHTLVPEKNIEIMHQPPELSWSNPQAINLCHGRYVKKVSLSQQFKSFHHLAILMLVTVLTFLSVNAIDIYIASADNKTKQHNIEQVFRSVIVRGVMNDPVDQLRTKLRKSSSVTNDSSRAVYLLANIAPVIDALEIAVSTINYSNKEKALRLNIQADSFNHLEKLRTEINSKGLFAQLLGSNAVDNKFQARLSISLEER